MYKKKKLCVEDIDFTARPVVITVEGPDGRRAIETVADVEKLTDDFNDALNTVLSQRVELEEKLSKAYSSLTAADRERERQEGYKAGYQAAMLENASWNLD